jgi:hypothetical protein
MSHGFGKRQENKSQTKEGIQNVENIANRSRETRKGGGLLPEVHMFSGKHAVEARGKV